MATTNGAVENGCGLTKCERVASWVGASVTTAFFSSLERCSCINIPKADSDVDEEANHRPLMLTKSPSSTTDTSSPRPPATA